MKAVFYIFTLIITTQFSFGIDQLSFAQKSPDHIIEEDEPGYMRVNILVTDERNKNSLAFSNIEEIITQDLKKEFSSIKLHFAQKIDQLKRSGDNINIMIRAKSIAKEKKVDKSIFAVHYKVMIYDMSKTPIMIRDGNIKFDMDFNPSEDEHTAIKKTICITNQRLIEFLRRNITYKGFQKKNEQSN